MDEMDGMDVMDKLQENLPPLSTINYQLSTINYQLYPIIFSTRSMIT